MRRKEWVLITSENEVLLRAKTLRNLAIKLKTTEKTARTSADTGVAVNYNGRRCYIECVKTSQEPTPEVDTKQSDVVDECKTCQWKPQNGEKCVLPKRFKWLEKVGG